MIFSQKENQRILKQKCSSESPYWLIWLSRSNSWDITHISIVIFFQAVFNLSLFSCSPDPHGLWPALSFEMQIAATTQKVKRVVGWIYRNVHVTLSRFFLLFGFYSLLNRWKVWELTCQRKWSGTDELTVTGKHREVLLRSLSCACWTLRSHVWQLRLAPDVQRLGSTLRSSIPEAWQRLWAIIALLVFLWDTEDDLLALTKVFLCWALATLWNTILQKDGDVFSYLAYFTENKKSAQ